jgi:Thoeris protein ThsB, TIR-like domain
VENDLMSVTMAAVSDPDDRKFPYKAFLSYRASDAKQAEWLHRVLEQYVAPQALVGTRGDYGVVPRRLGRIFRDRDEARSSEHIEKVIGDELSRSQHLIVLCTPNAVAPDSWVPREIALFRERRPDGVIHAVIGSGVPPACFHSRS